jgi:hypothetical protein
VSGPLCGDADGTDPDPDPPTLASIQISSPVDSVMAVGRTVRLTAVARDGTGAIMSGVALSWSATPASVLTVSVDGLVTGVGGGSGVVRAAASGVTTDFGLRAIPADLDGIATTLGDAFLTALLSGLDTGTAAAVSADFAACASAVTSGNVLGLDQCLAAVRGVAGTGSANDQVRLAVTRLFVDHASTQLQLGR